MSEFEALCNATSANATDEVKALCALASSLNESNATMEELIFGVNSFFLIFGASLVFMMQTGFAMLCAGCIRQKNVKNIILKNLLDACGGAIGFFTVGYAFAFGATDDKTTFIGNTFFWFA
jgi:Amt family ammonium transporter